MGAAKKRQKQMTSAAYKTRDDAAARARAAGKGEKAPQQTAFQKEGISRRAKMRRSRRTRGMAR